MEKYLDLTGLKTVWSKTKEQDATTLASAKSYSDTQLSTAKSYTDTSVAGKQDKLTAGTNISITNNTVSCTLSVGSITTSELEEILK